MNKIIKSGISGSSYTWNSAEANSVFKSLAKMLKHASNVYWNTDQINANLSSLGETNKNQDMKFKK